MREGDLGRPHLGVECAVLGLVEARVNQLGAALVLLAEHGRRLAVVAVAGLKILGLFLHVPLYVGYLLLETLKS